jgi:hypothetical protein
MPATVLGNHIDRWILKKGFRVALPLVALQLIEARRALFQRKPASVIEMKSSSEWNDFIPKNLGYKQFEPSAFPEIPSIVQSCKVIYEAHKEEVIEASGFNKEYFYNLATEIDLKKNPALMDFALGKTITEIVTGYLPNARLHSIGVFYSSVNDTIDGSQLFHVDGDCLKQMKCFINIWDVDEGAGPFTCLPLSATTSTLRNRGLIKRLTDEDVNRETGYLPYIRATGPAGSGLFCDTSRCLHQGSRSRERSRLMLLIQFVSRPDALLARTANNVRKKGGHILVNRDLLHTLNITNPLAHQFVD